MHGVLREGGEELQGGEADILNTRGLWSFVIGEVRNSGRCALLVTVRTQGSGPGQPGAVMAVTSVHSFGTVGGGTLEMDLVRRAREMLDAGSSGPVLVEHRHSENPSDIGNPSGMICSGSQTTAVLTVGAGSLVELDLARDILANGRTGTLLLGPGGIGISGDEPAGSPDFRQSGEGDWTFRLHLGLADVVYIVGGGHVGRALAELLTRLPFRPCIIDDRPAPAADLPYQWLRSEFGEAHTLIPNDRGSWVVVVTPRHQADGEVLESLAGLDLRYVGLMASRAKRETIYARLREAGVHEEWIARIRSPIGLRIGGRSPWEIAVSIAAQLISEKCKN